jgi:hypothetical protein
VLISVGTNLICALAIKPGLCKSDNPPSSTTAIPQLTPIPCVAGINALFPTLLSPNALMVGLYWAVLYVLQGGFMRIPTQKQDALLIVQSASASLSCSRESRSPR